MSALSGLSALRELNLSFCQNITDAGLAELRFLSNLKTLNVANCPMLSDGGLDGVLNSLPRLSQVTPIAISITHRMGPHLLFACSLY